MKKQVLALVLIVAVGFFIGLVNVQAGTNGDKGFVTGQAVEISTYAMKGTGEGMEEAMLNRAGQGFPAAAPQAARGRSDPQRKRT